MIQTVNYRDCGFIQYKTAWDLQEQLLSENTQLKLSYLHTGIPASDIPTHHHLLFCEHNHVYTLGNDNRKTRSNVYFLQSSTSRNHFSLRVNGFY